MLCERTSRRIDGTRYLIHSTRCSVLWTLYPVLCTQYSVRFAALLFLLAIGLTAHSAAAQDLLPGEFGDITLDRPLVEPTRIPTIRELRQLAARPEIEPVLLLRLHGGGENHAVPVWSPDGRRLAFLHSNVDANSSKLLLFRSLADTDPVLLTGEAGWYDSMFRWGVESQTGFVFVRVESATKHSRLMFSADGEKVQPLDGEPGVYGFPALFERTDGIWRLLFERDGNLLHRAWNSSGDVEPPLAIGRGSAPRWHRDGRQMLLLRERTRAGRLAAIDLAIHDLRTGAESLLETPRAGTLRAPVWSPDGNLVAFHVRDTGDNRPWRIDLASIDIRAAARTIADDVVVNPDFTSEGPAWSPDGRQLWFFSNQRREQAFYPAMAYDLVSGSQHVVRYHTKLTTPADLAMNPHTATPEVAFVAYGTGETRDLYVMLLNHF